MAREPFIERRIDYDPFTRTYFFCKPIKVADGKFNDRGEQQKGIRKFYNRLAGILADFERGRIYGYKIIIDSPLVGLTRGVYCDDRGPSFTDLVSELKHKLEEQKGVKTA